MFTKEQEYTNFVSNWRLKSPAHRGQTIRETATWFQEGNGKIDRFFFDEDENGDLISGPGFRVKESIRRHTYLGQIEGQAFDSLDRARKNGENLFFWISPPHPDRGPNLKVIITESVMYKGQKRWLNRSLLLGSDYQRNLAFVTGIVELSKNKPSLISLEDIRRNILVFDPKLDWVGALAKAANSPGLTQIIRSGQDEVDQHQALERANRFYDEVIGGPSVELRVQPSAFMIKKYEIGDLPSPCPPETAFQFFDRNALPIGESKSYSADSCPEIKCRGCGWKPKPHQLKMIQDGKMTRCPDCKKAP